MCVDRGVKYWLISTYKNKNITFPILAFFFVFVVTVLHEPPNYCQVGCTDQDIQGKIIKDFN